MDAKTARELTYNSGVYKLIQEEAIKGKCFVYVDLLSNKMVNYLKKLGYDVVESWKEVSTFLPGIYNLEKCHKISW